MVLLLMTCEVILVLKELATVTALIINTALQPQVQVMEKSGPWSLEAPMLLEITAHLQQDLVDLDQAHILVSLRVGIQAEKSQEALWR